ncbi:MAG: fructosamine kinase family protein [Parafilimonas sp.]
MKQILDHIVQQLSRQFNQLVQIQKQTQVFGGDINKTFHLKTNIGAFFLKLNDGSLKDMFEKEFTGLQQLHQTKTIKIPEVVLHGNFGNEIFLVTEFIQQSNPSKHFWQTFAYNLAALHRQSNAEFGLSTDNYIGSLHQQNNFCNTWSEFYASQRILPLVRKAFDENKLTISDVKLAEKLCTRFYNLFAEEKPALVHGDLWSGNFMCNKDGEAVVFDPAVYYGNREMDIGLSLLFGGFDTRFYDYYNDAFPLQPNWKDRVKLCQFYPLLVHLVLFGGQYYNKVADIIKQYQ